MPLIGALILAVKHLLGKLKEKEEEIKGLQKELRETEKESLESMLKVLGFLEKAENKEEVQHKELLSKIEQFKNDILVKLAELNK